MNTVAVEKLQRQIHTEDSRASRIEHCAWILLKVWFFSGTRLRDFDECLNFFSVLSEPLCSLAQIIFFFVPDYEELTSTFFPFHPSLETII